MKSNTFSGCGVSPDAVSVNKICGYCSFPYNVPGEIMLDLSVKAISEAIAAHGADINLNYVQNLDFKEVGIIFSKTVISKEEADAYFFAMLRNSHSCNVLQ